jgi:hypothetical protein
VTAYVVRVKAGVPVNGPRIVGFFVAGSLTQLAWLADQVGDPNAMEATEVDGAGGVIWEHDARTNSWVARLDEYCDVPNEDVGLVEPEEDGYEGELEWFDLKPHFKLSL